MHPETDLSRVIAAAGAAHAQEKIRVGRIGPFSGPFASVGVMFKQGIETYLAANGTKVGGRDVELLYRDTAGTNPAVAKQRAEELIVRDKAQILPGLYLSPEARSGRTVLRGRRGDHQAFPVLHPCGQHQRRACDHDRHLRVQAGMEARLHRRRGLRAGLRHEGNLQAARRE